MRKINFKNEGALVLFLLLPLFFAATGCETPNRAIIANKLISTEQARLLSTEFVNKYQGVDQNLSTYAWFSTEELRQYLLFAEHVGDSLNLEASGMRVYFGVYPKDDSYGEKAGKGVTVFFSPTYESRKGDEIKHLNIPFDPLNFKYMLNFGNMGYPPRLKFGDPE
ncbi:MAG TPA: hypothetical protein PLQ57_14445 [Saprospiraceae bacterium]|nr:hypothetical protein [Saprospiraceae bacterium]